MSENQVRGNSPFGTGWIRNTWPRPGMTDTSVTGKTVLGRFAADSDCWQFDGVAGTASKRGLGDPVEALQGLLSGMRVTSPRAGALGYVSYELGAFYLGLTFPALSNCDRQLPPMQFLIFEEIEHPATSPAACGQSNTHSYTRDRLDRLFERESITPIISKPRYLADVAQIQEHIAAGDIYQANYTQAFDVRTQLKPSENLKRLTEQMRAPYTVSLSFAAASIRQADGRLRQYPSVTIMAASPERFWRKRGSRLDCRPIKGTIARSSLRARDIMQRRLLLESKKDRSELLMITDLMRNDLGQVAEIGSVKTEALVRIRPTPSVWHLESTVTARLAEGKSWVDAMKSLLPAGSITGTPKRRAVEILAGLEAVPRGPYCGALGWVDVNGDADFAVGIRTCVQIGDRIRIHGGGGIVADSDPESEYYESLVKIAPLLETFSNPKTYREATTAAIGDRSNA